MPDLTQYFPITNPSLIFFLVLVIILLAPIIMGKLRIPHIIGMVLAGVAIGQYGFNILVRDDSFELFGRVGLYYIMFLAALEMDVEGVKKNKGRLSLFGLLTFAAPFTLTFIMSEWLLGYPTIASLLLGCLMASNTLIAYPIVSRYGQQRKPSVALSVGASMLSLLVALVVLGIAQRADGRAVLAVVRSQVCDLLWRPRHPHTQAHALVPASLQRRRHAVYLRHGHTLHECCPEREHRS